MRFLFKNPPTKKEKKLKNKTKQKAHPITSDKQHRKYSFLMAHYLHLLYNNYFSPPLNWILHPSCSLQWNICKIQS